MMKVLAEGKPGVEKVIKKLRECGLEFCENEPEIVVVWGGDGSILRAARKYPKSCLLGLRVQSLGHLAEIDGSRFDYAIERLVRKEYRIEELPRVELIYNSLRIHGLNEVYFFRQYEYATRFRVFIDEEEPYEDELFGDGCLVATPRGSTAYSWTAGRKLILKPDEEKFAFTPLSSGCLNKMIIIRGTSVAKPVEQLGISSGKEILIKIIRGGKNKFAADGLEIHGWLVRCLARRSQSIAIPRSCATSSRVRRWESARSVALTRLTGLLDP